MLKALKNQLSLMAIEYGDDYAKRIRQRLGRRHKGLHISRTLNLVLMMPDLVARCSDLSGSERVPSPVRRLNGFLLTYLYHPIDFVPDDGSLFGYLDDAYFVGRVFEKVREHVPGVHTAAEELYRDLPRSLEAARVVLPEESRQIDRMIAELEDGRQDLFHRLMNKARVEHGAHRAKEE
ncbi:MAG: hypothetical protein MOGMAGMI_02096 [Candidatus Omnitrophica bacterium]|nr:hypothetical protein [Candidatus Omnitrophota bacterium]